MAIAEVKAMQATASVSRKDKRRVLGAQMAKLGVRLKNKYAGFFNVKCAKRPGAHSRRPIGRS